MERGAYEVPVTVLILRNEEYAILKWFASSRERWVCPASTSPASTAWRSPGYGMRARRVEGADELRAALADAIGIRAPELIEVPIAPGMSLG